MTYIHPTHPDMRPTEETEVTEYFTYDEDGKVKEKKTVTRRIKKYPAPPRREVFPNPWTHPINPWHQPSIICSKEMKVTC